MVGMDGWIAGWTVTGMDGLQHGWKGGSQLGWMDGLGWMDTWKDHSCDGWIDCYWDGWMDGSQLG